MPEYAEVCILEYVCSTATLMTQLPIVSKEFLVLEPSEMSRMRCRRTRPWRI